MTDDNDDVGMGTLFWLVLQKKYNEIKESAKPKVKKVIKIIACIFGGTFVLSLMLIILGTSLEMNAFTLIGRVGIIFLGGCLLLLATPIGFALTGRRYITFIRHCVLYQISAVLVLWFTPLPITLSIMCGISFVGFLIAVVNALANEKWVKCVTTALFLILLSSAFVPRMHALFYSKIIEFNQPQLLQLRHGYVKEVPFFLNRKPVAWYAIDTDKKYVLYDGKGFDRFDNKELEPMTSPLSDLLRRHEELISPRNFVDGQVPYEFGKKSSEIPSLNPPQSQSGDSDLEKKKAELERQQQEVREEKERLERERRDREQARVVPTPDPNVSPQSGPYKLPMSNVAKYSIASSKIGNRDGELVVQRIAQGLGATVVNRHEPGVNNRSIYLIVVRKIRVEPRNGGFGVTVVLSVMDNRKPQADQVITAFGNGLMRAGVQSARDEAFGKAIDDAISRLNRFS